MTDVDGAAAGGASDPPIFLVEDDPDVRRACAQTLRIADWPVREFADAEAALAQAALSPPAAVVSDLRLPGQDGLALLRALRQRDSEVPVVLITGHGDVAVAVQAMREGAHDFIEKPFGADRLVAVLQRALAQRRLQAENRQLRSSLQACGHVPLVGQSHAIQQARQLIATLAPTDVDILIEGPTGSGKEVAARAIHDASGRRGPFVAINCAALPESVFESEMFGHEGGAFTGASKRRVGRIEYAHQGTLFLDEIESMPLALQAKLLRVLQERTLERLGSNASVAVDCRVVAATKDNLLQLAHQGRFRADLYYRLNVVTLQLPPLRERPEDVAVLAAYLLQQAALRFQRPIPAYGAAELLRWQAYDWPGNVRELRNTMERFCLGLPDGLAPPPPQAATGATEPTHRPLAEQVEAAERSIIESALRACAGSVTQAAQRLQLPRKTLYDKLHRLGVAPESYRTDSAPGAG